MSGKSQADGEYTAGEKKFMLQTARAVIAARLSGGSGPDLTGAPESLRKIRSCFVTLHTKGGDLRGCIGNIGAFEPLIDNIRGNAFNAAFRDPRFRPVSSEEELKGLEFEISVLTEAEPIDGPDSFVIGEHGIILQKNGRSAVFLPQVAPEQGWDVPETLTHLSMKAGLGPDAWREKDTRFSVFRAVVFAERDFA